MFLFIYLLLFFFFNWNSQSNTPSIRNINERVCCSSHIYNCCKHWTHIHWMINFRYAKWWLPSCATNEPEPAILVYNTHNATHETDRYRWYVARPGFQRLNHLNSCRLNFKINDLRVWVQISMLYYAICLCELLFMENWPWRQDEMKEKNPLDSFCTRRFQLRISFSLTL